MPEGGGGSLSPRPAPTASPSQQPQASSPQPQSADPAHVVHDADPVAGSSPEPGAPPDSGTPVPQAADSAGRRPSDAQEPAQEPPHPGVHIDESISPAPSGEAEAEGLGQELVSGQPAGTIASGESSPQSEDSPEAGAADRGMGELADLGAGAPAPAPSAASAPCLEPAASGASPPSEHGQCDSASDKGSSSSGHALARPSVALASTPGSEGTSAGPQGGGAPSSARGRGATEPQGAGPSSVAAAVGHPGPSPQQSQPASPPPASPVGAESDGDEAAPAEAGGHAGLAAGYGNDGGDRTTEDVSALRLRAEKAEAALAELQALRGAAEDGSDLEDLEGMVLSASHRAVEAAAKSREVSSPFAAVRCPRDHRGQNRDVRSRCNEPGSLGAARQWSSLTGTLSSLATAPCHWRGSPLASRPTGGVVRRSPRCCGCLCPGLGSGVARGPRPSLGWMARAEAPNMKESSGPARRCRAAAAQAGGFRAGLAPAKVAICLPGQLPLWVREQGRTDAQGPWPGAESPTQTFRRACARRSLRFHLWPRHRRELLPAARLLSTRAKVAAPLRVACRSVHRSSLESCRPSATAGLQPKRSSRRFEPPWCRVLQAPAQTCLSISTLRSWTL